MTAPAKRSLTLSDDEFLALAASLGTQELPTVLSVRNRYRTIDQRDSALGEASRGLTARGLICDGAVQPELAEVLQAFHRPDRELAMRLVTPDGIARVSVVRRGALCVLARRVGEVTAFRFIGHDVELRDAASALLTELPSAKAADTQPVAAPLDEFMQCLCGSADPAGLADEIRALGADPHAALRLGTALATPQAFAEIVYYSLATEEGRISRGPGAVAVFYTKRGRVIGTPSMSAASQLWTTLTTGSDHVLAQAIGRLVELSNQGWRATDTDPV